jgi:DUF4097 and DUF4098 domain-containing protein YvlB
VKIHALSATLVVLAAAVPVSAQMRDNTQPEMKCEDRAGSERPRYCEMREQTIAYPGQLAIDARQNGGVTVRGWSRSDVWIRMRVQASAGSESEARALASQVRVNASGGRVSADGPKGDGDEHWSVSYEVFTPHNANVEITTHNGGVHVSDVRGDVSFSAVNGGVHLARVDGRVHGQTTNGGLHIELAGSRWEGEGMDVATTNGGIHLAIPENYSALLEGSTANGGLHVDFPITVQGKITKHISTSLGAGGALLSVKTTNGGIHVNRI